MPRGIKYSAEQMDQVLQACKTANQSEVARKFGISEKTISKLRTKFKGMNTSDIKRAKQLEEENQRLKRIITNLTIDNDILKEINSKKW